MLARIAVSAAIYAIDKPFTYFIPESMENKARPGCRVVVPFGRSNKQVEGLILSVGEGEEAENIKGISSLLDPEPVFTDEQLKLAVWIRERYFCTVFEAAHTMLPVGMWYSPDSQRRVSDKVQKFAVLQGSGEDAMFTAGSKAMSAPKQSRVLELLAAVGEAAVSDIMRLTDASSATLRTMEKKGLIAIEHREVFRRPARVETEAEPIVLNEEQETAFRGLRDKLLSGKPSAALLYGVTGSGKTSVYIRLVDEALKSGRTALVMVPEIGLTPQLMEIFTSHFGDDVAVLHSSLTLGERYDEWKRIKRGQVHVVIGTRSAVFAPLEDIGLIVIDEEQEHTYKSENSPRYHARDVAKFRCIQHNALLLLGSATPSVESMYAAREGRYGFFSIRGRYNAQPLPRVIIADMREEVKAGNGTSISAPLREELQRNIESGEQSILFLNRRGAAGLVMCGECGYTFRCKNCSVSMTYHSVGRRLRCHYCGWNVPLPDKCPECGGKLKYIGVGTQKLETELNELFPGVGVVRMDTDTVSRSGSHQKLLNRFKNERVPILLGTQMVTKGLDFANVTLAAVISADQSLYASDFRAHERTFSLITQVVGRSGRGDKAGRAILQTFTPDNYVLNLAARQDYTAFYESEINMRRLMQVPPIRDIITVTVTGLDEPSVLKVCLEIKECLEKCLDRASASVLGPAPAGIIRVNNRYRYKLTVTCRNDHRVRDLVSGIVKQYPPGRDHRRLAVYADSDPLE